ncbi:hypothetical protein CPB84DRAFT_1755767 [Gymnopilus junonius]|uniref:FAD-binding PCMH-type domain-containing protein n=1 Tax=Gymnopilus junonius TaxID=109634 RepID=A0A9P5N781_GYMJU|nr:hypothetical protein CPB84DRAFT_1755767 [Gymnopilus junonius]
MLDELVETMSTMFGSLVSSFFLLNLAAATRGTSPAWNALNSTVGGRLQVGVPLAQPCFSLLNGGAPNVPNPTECSDIQTNYENHIFRSDHFGAYEIIQWETCQTTGDECLLDWTNATNPQAFAPPAQCRQGSISNYYIDVTGPSDVIAAFTFSKSDQVPLVIKNTGHDYIGRSAAPGSLALWTHHLDKLVLNRTFVPTGCSGNPTTAITVGAGQQFETVYAFAAANNVTVVAGADPGVGLSGGWVMGGGHGGLSPSMGLGVDRVLEFKIVTPDGQYRIANKCQNTDLFFALRGGGGGTFGVVIESTHIASPQVTVQAVQWQMASDGWGGYITWHMGQPNLNSTAAQQSAAGAVEAFASVGGTTTFFVMDSYTEFYDTFIASNTDASGRPQVLASRLIPADKFTDETLIDSLVDGVVSSEFGQILSVAPFAFKDFDNGTSINPAWRTAVWHSLISYYWNFNSTLSERVGLYNKLEQQWAVVRQRTPGAAVYFNEADVYEPNYIDAYWGATNYAKLLAIKQKYDPNHLLRLLELRRLERSSRSSLQVLPKHYCG